MTPEEKQSTKQIMELHAEGIADTIFGNNMDSRNKEKLRKQLIEFMEFINWQIVKAK